MTIPSLRYAEKPPLTNDELNRLFEAAWPAHAPSDFTRTLTHCLTYFAAYADGRLAGFVKVAWDGDRHAFLLDPSVHPAFRRLGIGLELVRLASAASRAAGAEWLHVDYEPALAEFYRRAGFAPTAAGLMRLRAE